MKKPAVDPYLQEKAHRFDFLQLVRLLERANPGKRPVGEGVEPQKETVRFRSRVGFDFPAGNVAKLEPGRPELDEPPVMWVNFLGLAGQFGPLPQVISELIQQRQAQKDFAARDFLDIFNHRLLSLMVRIHKKNKPGVEVKPPQDADFTQYIFALLGMGTPGLRGRSALNDRALIAMSGLLMRPSHTIQGLKNMIQAYFDIPVTAKQFCGKWVQLENDQQSMLSSGPNGAALGNFPVLGNRAWDQQSGFELTIGPLERKAFKRFLPGGEAYKQFQDLVKFYAGPTLEADLTLVMKAEPLTGVRLSTSESEGDCLGWTTWLASPSSNKDLVVHIKSDTDQVTGQPS